MDVVAVLFSLYLIHFFYFLKWQIKTIIISISYLNVKSEKLHILKPSNMYIYFITRELFKLNIIEMTTAYTSLFTRYCYLKFTAFSISFIFLFLL